MTREELIAFGQARHGKRWIGPLSAETRYSFSQVWKMANGKHPVSYRMELEIEKLQRSNRKPRP